MKLLSFVAAYLVLEKVRAQSLDSSCLMPEDIPSSRLNRLHHSCESNQNRDFAIVTHSDFYCIFYSVLQIFVFEAESKFEIKIEGDWEYEQVCEAESHLF